MYTRRTGEVGPQHCRRQRYFKHGNYWYYNTREGAPIGPFDHLMAAVNGCNDYLEYLKQAPSLADIIAQHNEVELSQAVKPLRRARSTTTPH